MSWLTSWLYGSRASNTSAQSTSQDHRLLEEARPPQPEPSSPVETALKAQPVAAQQTAQAERPNRSKIIFAAGLAFFGFSLLITRRAFARKRLANQAFSAHGPEAQAEQAKKVSGAVEALEALNIATINVVSLAMMATGGGMWYLNINSMEDARRKLRGGLGVDGTGRTEKDAEEEFEEWMATVLARKDSKQAESTRPRNGRE